MRSRTKWESPHKLFPANNPVAALVATLCILREDVYLELIALAADEIQPTFSNWEKPAGLDDNGKIYRQMYFLRASLRTLREVRETLQGLFALEAFRDLLAKDAKADARVRGYLKALNKSIDEIIKIRNNLGGHVLPDAVKDALSKVENLHETGKFDVGRTYRETHYGFIVPLVAQVLFLDVPDEEKKTHFEKILALNDSTLEIIELVLIKYLETQGYFKDDE